ncbi:type I-C CRISPR-associated protein Cas5c [Rubrivirga sp.]|uniref:type I-C CRISPR-associated protein Cas5c n=1 Tax=Rubrivirga sp. TaxID=1885344 RepID=UPI003B5277A8
MADPHISLAVWGDLALFSRPDLRVERVSYPVITPSAARGVFEAVFWKPEFSYRIRRIDVVKPGTTVSVLRNEIKNRQSDTPIQIEKARTQRTALMLQNVRYVLHADLVLRPHATDHVAKYRCQLERAIGKGRCFHRPYLGTRECAAHFAVPGADDTPDDSFSLHLGTMLFDLAFVPGKATGGFSFRRQDGEGKKVVPGSASPVFFDARVERGVLDLDSHQHLYREIDSLQGYAI